ncbi:hypothetical protein ACFL5O_00290 [Myxococcota bacterium]
MPHVLPFEKPLVDLVTRVRELRDSATDNRHWAPELSRLEERVALLAREVLQNLSAPQKVQLSRHPDCPYTLDYVQRLMTDWVELHGDRRFADDGALVAGLGRYRGRSVAVVGHQKGRTTAAASQRLGGGLDGGPGSFLRPTRYAIPMERP